jgi:hypothetical protein
MRVYHFIEARWGLADISNKTLKISRLHDLNDPFELYALELSDSNIRSAFSKVKDELHKNRGILCFSDRWSNPVMWSHYADKHRGVCLEFEVPNINLMKVTYRFSRLKEELLQLSAKDPIVAERAMQSCLTTKFSHWKYEREWRVFAGLETPGADGNYFADFAENLKLTGVIVGPRSLVSRDDLETTFSKSQLDYRPVSFKARLAFKSFRVVKNENENLWK